MPRLSPLEFARRSALRYARSLLGREDTVIRGVRGSATTEATWWVLCYSESLANGDPFHRQDGRWTMLVMDGEVVEGNLPVREFPSLHSHRGQEEPMRQSG